jgi:hypothetical protein
MNCEWCGGPGIKRADGSVTCDECRSGFDAPRLTYGLFIAEVLVIVLVVFLAWKFIPGWTE